MLYLNILLILSVIADGAFSQQPRGQPPPINQFQQPQPGAGIGEECVKATYEAFRHLKEHLKNKIDVDSQSDWSDEKEVFYYFELADLNKDFYIDGLELIQTVTAHEHSSKRLLQRISFNISHFFAEFCSR
ncbi:unnamed protein product [Anisakis simplex]|uniref:EF-hand domain-containing protein n=1 Tax=Anisakis simplex TaxID=6269 RepID=A0A0M3J6A1_ANISI|nr:unnamed protein product [Anisakis simplex]